MCIRVFEDGTELRYEAGNFDNWCVYRISRDGEREAPRDVDYFTQLNVWKNNYRYNKVYNDIKEIFELTGKNVEQKVLKKIDEIASTYKEEDILEVEIIYTIIYMTMIAEENRRNTRLGKRIKMLGIYQVLELDYAPQQAANFSKGMKADELIRLCNEYGF